MGSLGESRLENRVVHRSTILVQEGQRGYLLCAGLDRALRAILTRSLLLRCHFCQCRSLRGVGGGLGRLRATRGRDPGTSRRNVYAKTVASEHCPNCRKSTVSLSRSRCRVVPLCPRPTRRGRWESYQWLTSTSEFSVSSDCMVRVDLWAEFGGLRKLNL